MAMQLVVLKPFLNFVKGDVIRDAEQIRAILLSEHRSFVTKVGSANEVKG